MTGGRESERGREWKATDRPADFPGRSAPSSSPPEQCSDLRNPPDVRRENPRPSQRRLVPGGGTKWRSTPAVGAERWIVCSQNLIQKPSFFTLALQAMREPLFSTSASLIGWKKAKPLADAGEGRRHSIAGGKRRTGSLQSLVEAQSFSRVRKVPIVQLDLSANVYPTTSLARRLSFNFPPKKRARGSHPPLHHIVSEANDILEPRPAPPQTGKPPFRLDLCSDVGVWSPSSPIGRKVQTLEGGILSTSFSSSAQWRSVDE